VLQLLSVVVWWITSDVSCGTGKGNSVCCAAKLCDAGCKCMVALQALQSIAALQGTCSTHCGSCYLLQQSTAFHDAAHCIVQVLLCVLQYTS
jgi:hypothetical protein